MRRARLPQVGGRGHGSPCTSGWWVGLSLVIAVVGLVGCQRNAREVSQTRELVLWHAYRGDEEGALVKAAKAFETARGVRVRLVGIPFNAFADKITVGVPRGHGPDVFISAHDRIGDWAASKIIEPIGFWADEALIDRFFLATVKPLVYRDDLYGLPLAFKTLALFYDRTLVDDVPETTDGLIKKTQALRQQNPEIWGLAYELDSLYFHAPWLHGFGGRIYADDRDTVALGTPEAAASLSFVRALVTVHKVVPEEVTSALVTALFKEHKLAYVLSGPWFLGELSGGEGHDDWGVGPLPIVSATGQRAKPYLGSEAILLSAHSKQKKLAFDLMKFLTNDELAPQRFVEGGQLVANKAAYQDPRLQKSQVAQAFQKQLSDTVPLSNRPHMRRVWEPVKTALSQAITHGMPPTKALAEAVKRIERD